MWLRNLKGNRENHINQTSSKIKVFVLGRIQRHPRNGRKYLESSYLSDLQFGYRIYENSYTSFIKTNKPIEINTGSDNHFSIISQQGNENQNPRHCVVLTRTLTKVKWLVSEDVEKLDPPSLVGIEDGEAYSSLDDQPYSYGVSQKFHSECTPKGKKVHTVLYKNINGNTICNSQRAEAVQVDQNRKRKDAESILVEYYPTIKKKSTNTSCIEKTPCKNSIKKDHAILFCSNENRQQILILEIGRNMRRGSRRWRLQSFCFRNWKFQNWLW